MTLSLITLVVPIGVTARLIGSAVLFMESSPQGGGCRRDITWGWPCGRARDHTQTRLAASPAASAVTTTTIAAAAAAFTVHAVTISTSITSITTIKTIIIWTARRIFCLGWDRPVGKNCGSDDRDWCCDRC